MLLRIDPTDERTPRTLEASARAVTQLAARRRIAMVEPFWATPRPRARCGRSRSRPRSGTTSAYTWLKVPIVDDMERVMAATTLPSLILGGGGPAAFDAWAHALTLPPVRGLVVGRSLLYPHDDDVAAAVDTAASLLG